MKEQTDHEINVDPLTGLVNRNCFVREGQKILKQNPQKYAVVFLDLDNFKVYNSSYSVHAGDILLRYTGRTIQKAFDQQLVARFGDDHFYVLTEKTLVENGVKTICERLHNYDSDIRVEVKAGICEGNEETDEIVKMCDQAKIACGKIKHIYDAYLKYYDSSLARVSAGRFILLRQFTDPEDISRIRSRIVASVSGQCTDMIRDLDMSVDTCRYSKVPEEKRRSFPADIMKGTD